MYTRHRQRAPSRPPRRCR
ncbi:hypothetical protein E2C01_092278 [Portunus trituberculatus]|uniref:Uncharacterized protein n=1 Tax=Portunus trituberculatus TaxID=210409 RepID=A0A5B7JG35_PORTR|nr:hypothetical protein [Portunus trituberculatus]